MSGGCTRFHERHYRAELRAEHALGVGEAALAQDFDHGRRPTFGVEREFPIGRKEPLQRQTLVDLRAAKADDAFHRTHRQDRLLWAVRDFVQLILRSPGAKNLSQNIRHARIHPWTRRWIAT